jgi:hypothetical protein
LFLKVLEAEVQDQGEGRFNVWWGPASWFMAFLLCPHGGKDWSATLWSLHIGALNLLMSLPDLLTPPGPTLTPLPWGLGFQHRNGTGVGGGG